MEQGVKAEAEPQLVRGEPRAKLCSPEGEPQLTKLRSATLCFPESLPSQGSPGPFSNQNLRVYKETAQNGLRKERHQMAENIPEEDSTSDPPKNLS